MQFPDRIRVEFENMPKALIARVYDANTGEQIKEVETVRLDADGYHGVVAEVYFVVNRGGQREHETVEVKYRWPNLEITATNEAQTRET